MEIATRRSGAALVVDMSGSLDSHTAGDAGDRLVGLVQGADQHILLNIGRLDYMSSAGMRVILRAAKLLQARRGELRICNANDTVRDVLVTSGFNSLVKLYGDEMEALKAFPG